MTELPLHEVRSSLRERVQRRWWQSVELSSYPTTAAASRGTLDNINI